MRVECGGLPLDFTRNASSVSVCSCKVDDHAVPEALFLDSKKISNLVADPVKSVFA